MSTWTAQELETLTRRWHDYTVGIADIARELKRRPSAIQAKASVLGLGRRRRAMHADTSISLPASYRAKYVHAAQKRGMRTRDLCLLLLDIIAEEPHLIDAILDDRE